MRGTKFGMTFPVGKAIGLMAGAGLAVSAHAGVQEIVWVEVDNSVGTMGDATGEPTGLDGVRTFDLFAIVTDDTRVWAADFGFVGTHQGFDDNMWTTQSVYQHEMGGDTQSQVAGAIRSLSALEFDTYVGLGMLDSKVVMNTTILGVEWSPGMFEGAWYGSQYTGDYWTPATGDDDGKLFLARVSVESMGGYGDATGGDEWLGGRIFISGEDDRGEFGQHDPRSGLFLTPNAFPEHAPANVAGSNGGGSGNDVVVEPEPSEIDPYDGEMTFDLNGDGSVNAQDLLVMQQHFGGTDGRMDFNLDGVIDALDVQMLVDAIEAEAANPTDDMTPKERKQYEKAQRKAEKQREKEARQAAKAAEKEQKRLEKERKKEEKRREKEAREAAKRGGTM